MFLRNGTRSNVIAFLACCLLSAPAFQCISPDRAMAQATERKVPRIGYLHTVGSLGPYDRAFLKGLHDLGYVEGKTIVIEHRFGRGEGSSRLGALAEEFVGLKVDVIVALVPAAVRAAMKTTRTIPIVARFSRDPAEEGMVGSLARPGGNVTGITSIAQDLIAKRIQLLKELAPGLTRLGVMWDSGSRRSGKYFSAAEAAARSLGVTALSLPLRGADDIEPAFRAAADGNVQGFVTVRNPVIVRNRARIAALAIQNGLPAVFDEREFTVAGGLISYGANLADLYRRAATYVDKILKGARPADLPIELATEFDLVVNLRTAKALGIELPRSILLRADKVIE